MIYEITIQRTTVYEVKVEAQDREEAPCGADAARRGDYDRAYTFNCPECDREYCAECLKDKPGYNADGDCVGDPPTMVDASSWRGFCRKCQYEEVTQQ